MMMVNTQNLISMTEANQNFSKVARMVDERGTVVILKNNVPQYVVLSFAQAEGEAVAADESVMDISARLMEQNRKAYKVLAQ